MLDSRDFPVGAAVLTKSGMIVPGCNVEIASYGLTTCAEQNAVFSPATFGPQDLDETEYGKTPSGRSLDEFQNSGF